MALASTRPARRSSVALLAVAVAALPGIAGAIRVAWNTDGTGGAMAAWAGALALVVVSCGAYVHLYTRLRWSLADGESRASLTQAGDHILAPVPGPGPSVLVPAYREEPAALARTLLAASLQTRPAERIVLLLDDADDETPLARYRELVELPLRLRAALEPLRERCRQARTELSCTAPVESASSPAAIGGETEHEPAESVYRRLCLDLASWFQAQAAERATGDHADRHFGAVVCLRWAEILSDEAGKRLRLAGNSKPPAAEDVDTRIGNLARIFDPAFTVFERKRYANLAATRDKAGNLGAWLGLAPGPWREVNREGSRILVASDGTSAEFVVPDSANLVLIDADTLIAPDYTATMECLLDAPGNEDLALVQSPYRAFPHASGRLERIAGATTDVQFMVHQGMSATGAAFWVGANAMIRRSALESIARDDGSGRADARRYLRERTVIEDTETSLALRAAGWRLASLPRAMAWSATPPDFGALAVQRARWANGGFLLLGSLARTIAFARGARRPREIALRLHYLVSLAPTALALLLLPVFLIDAGATSVLLPLLALAYFTAYADDLRRAGYRRSDIVAVYALNLLLIPVQIAALFSSLQQAITGRKARFLATPKSGARTPVPGAIVVAELTLLGLWVLVAFDVAGASRGLHTALVAGHCLLLAWGIGALIGWRAALGDLAGDLAANVVPVAERREA
jgi:cellulose synthase (UDP-forming)